eukprot:2350438-Karenia_brevis.AAC.1
MMNGLRCWPSCSAGGASRRPGRMQGCCLIDWPTSVAEPMRQQLAARMRGLRMPCGPWGRSCHTAVGRGCGVQARARLILDPALVASCVEL